MKSDWLKRPVNPSSIKERLVISNVQLDELETKLGPTLCAFIAGSRQKNSIREWQSSSSRAKPNPAEVDRLLVALQLFNKVAETEGDDTARAWIIGSSVDGSSPAEAIRNGEFAKAEAAATRMINDEWS